MIKELKRGVFLKKIYVEFSCEYEVLKLSFYFLFVVVFVVFEKEQCD